MRRCGTCWIVLKPDEDIDQHAKTSRWHTEMIYANRARKDNP